MDWFSSKKSAYQEMVQDAFHQPRYYQQRKHYIYEDLESLFVWPDDVLLFLFGEPGHADVQAERER